MQKLILAIKHAQWTPKSHFRPYMVTPASIGHVYQKSIFCQNRDFWDFYDFLDLHENPMYM